MQLPPYDTPAIALLIFFIFMYFPELLLTAAPYLCLCGLIWLRRIQSPEADFFECVAAGSLVWSCVVWLASYTLSYLHLLSGPYIAAIWASWLAWIAGRLLMRRGSWRLAAPGAWIWAPGLLCLCALAAGICYPPNIHDVLTYHMPRIMHWLQNHSMEPFFTSIDRQIGMAPFNAMIALQSVAPAGSDILVNMGQWLALVGCAAGACSLARLLGGNGHAARCAAVFTVTLPAALIQASNMDSCLIVSFYICVAVHACLKWMRASGPAWQQIIMFAAALGFAILSKGSAYPVMLPFVCLIGWRCLREPGLRFREGAIAACIVVLLNIPHFIYAIQGTGNIVGSSEANIIRHPTPGSFIVNGAFNVIVNAPFMLAGDGAGFWMRFPALFGIDTGNEALWPWGGLEGVKAYLTPIDGVAANPLHMAALALTLLMAFFRKFKPPRPYAALLGFSAILFCLALVWHPWMTRIQLPLFILAAPIWGMFVSGIRRALITRGFYFVLCMGAIPAAVMCVERPLVPASWVAYYRDGVKHFISSPREELLFNYAPFESRAHREGADYLAGQRMDKLGLDIGDNGIEYPVWVLLKNRLPNLPKIVHIPPGDSAQPYIWRKPRHNTLEAEPLRIIKNVDGVQKIVYPAGSEPVLPYLPSQER